MAGEWVPDFLASLALTPNVAEACRRAGVSRQTAYERRGSDPDFAKGWDAALDESTDDLVGECYRRALEGTEKPVYQGGQLVGTVREYSDALAVFLLKAHRRRVYGDKVDLDHTNGGQAFQTVLYLPENGRDEPTRGADDPAAAGPAGDVPRDGG